LCTPYVQVFLVVSNLLATQPKSYMHSSSLPFVSTSIPMEIVLSTFIPMEIVLSTFIALNIPQSQL
jgi:hypothetical protein